MNLLATIIFGIVEGITEFLPISSTGHLILTAKVLAVLQSDFQKSFQIAIQLGAILSVIVLYWRSFLIDFKVLRRVLIAFIPTCVLGLVFYKAVKRYLLGSHEIVIISLFLGGIFLIAFELFHRRKEGAISEITQISYSQCLIIGLCQSLALVPGVSRALATILGGLALGLKRKTIVQFSFLLAVPTMMAATGLDLLKSAHNFSAEQFSFLIVGFLISFVVALFSIKFLLAFIKKHNFVLFGIYRILIAVIFWFYLAS